MEASLGQQSKGKGKGWDEVQEVSAVTAYFNAAVGATVIMALAGCTVNGKEFKQQKIAGEMVTGFLCGPREMGWAGDASSCVILSDSFQIGEFAPAGSKPKAAKCADDDEEDARQKSKTNKVTVAESDVEAELRRRQPKGQANQKAKAAYSDDEDAKPKGKLRMDQADDSDEEKAPQPKGKAKQKAKSADSDAEADTRQSEEKAKQKAKAADFDDEEETNKTHGKAKSKAKAADSDEQDVRKLKAMPKKGKGAESTEEEDCISSKAAWFSSPCGFST